MPVKGKKYDFTAPHGKPLDDIYLDDNWSKLQRTNGAVDVTLADPAANYGIHVLGLSPEIRTVQFYAPPTKQFAAIEEQFNFGDPFREGMGKHEYRHGDAGTRKIGRVACEAGAVPAEQVRLTNFRLAVSGVGDFVMVGGGMG